MDLFPAIDLRRGGAVRLVQGDYDRERTYGDPRALAERFGAAGAPWLHVVDLDAARTGEPVERSLVLELARAVPMPVQTGGGIRAARDIDELLGAGVRRVVLGTAALDDRRFLAESCARYPGQIVLGLDYRRVPGSTASGGASGRRTGAIGAHGVPGDDADAYRAPDALLAATHGWTTAAGEGAGVEVETILAETAEMGLAAVVATAIDRDGTLEGPDLDGLARLLAASRVPVVASGGVGERADLEALGALEHDGRRLAGVVVGRALVDGRIDVEEAVRVCAVSG